MIDFSARTTGLQGLDKELLADTRKVARSTLSKASTPFAKRMRDNLSKRGGPAPPGEPPARVTGALRDTVGKDRPRRDGDEMSVAVGIGVGRAKQAKAEEWRSKGINVFAYALLQERGGIGADGRRYPPRPFARTAEEEVEPEVVAILEEGLR